MKTLAEINAALEALQTSANEAVASLGDAATTEQVEEVKALVAKVQEDMAPLQAAQAEKMREEEKKALETQLTTLSSAIEELRKPGPTFNLGFGASSDEEGKALSDVDKAYATSGGYYNDIRKANKGVSEARERITSGFEGLNEEGKAMTEGTASQGGYLVRPAVERQLVEARELDNVLRGLCSAINVNTNSIQLDQLGLSTTAGWVAELATKPEATGMTLATVSASVFTAAGLATVSNQLLADSDPSVDTLVTADLTKRLVALEETAFLTGSGTNQPLGILNTPGLGAQALTDTGITALLGKILDAISDVETAHGSPNAILMHPRTWTRILRAQDAQGAYFIDPAGGPQDPRTGQRGPVKSLWGYPVVTSNRMPTNLGAGTNESRVIVGDFKEALILDRQGITVDESQHVYFTTNQTVFRAETRLGFTAGRTPTAFSVVGGAGLAAG